jgi:hypothetical protein
MREGRFFLLLALDWLWDLVVRLAGMMARDVKRQRYSPEVVREIERMVCWCQKAVSCWELTRKISKISKVKYKWVDDIVSKTNEGIPTEYSLPDICGKER